jgi:SAM-dependent methyltransferase
MGNNDELDPVLHSALHLDGSPGNIKKFYADWAEKYEEDTTNWQYAAPANAIKLLISLPDYPELDIDPRNRDIRIMDAGCGTGLLARLLHEYGYHNIDGFDLSAKMVDIARNLGIYGELEGNVDINQPIKESWLRRYDCTICIGVFTPGHVPPEALDQLIKLTRPGGLIIVSTRVAYYETEKYQAASDELDSRGRLKLLHSLKDATYTYDEKAHYWVYSALPD